MLSKKNNLENKINPNAAQISDSELTKQYIIECIKHLEAKEKPQPFKLH